MKTVPAITSPLWIVVFCDPPAAGKGDPWPLRFVSWALRAFLKPGFRHCFAVRPMHTSDHWLYVNHNLQCLDLFEVPQEYADGLTGETVAVSARRPVSWAPRLVPTCVTTVAHLLGVPAWPWTTPHALYRRLKQEENAMQSKPDTSAADAAAKAAQEEADATKAANEAKLRNLKAGQSGRPLLTFSGTGETGVGKTTLGAG